MHDDHRHVINTIDILYIYYLLHTEIVPLDVDCCHRETETTLFRCSMIFRMTQHVSIKEGHGILGLAFGYVTMSHYDTSFEFLARRACHRDGSVTHASHTYISTDAFFCSDAYEITRPVSTGTTTNEPQSQTIFFIDA
jgi:hypothetical protein